MKESEIEVTDEMVLAAVGSLTPFLEDGNLGCSDSRSAMRAALESALRVASEGAARKRESRG